MAPKRPAMPGIEPETIAKVDRITANAPPADVTARPEERSLGGLDYELKNNKELSNREMRDLFGEVNKRRKGAGMSPANWREYFIERYGYPPKG